MRAAVDSPAALDDHGDGFAAAETERREPVAGAALVERCQQRRQDARAAGADRVTERDRAAPDVHPRWIEVEGTDRGDRDDRERLVDFEEIDVAEPEAGTRHDLPDRVDRRDRELRGRP